MELIDCEAAREAKLTSETDDLRADMSIQCNNMVEEMGNDLAGYAFVVWGKSGSMKSAYSATKGLISPSLMPTLVSDALNRHMTVNVLQAELAKKK